MRIDDHSLAFNTDWLTTLELGYSLEVAQAMAHSALQRKESRGAHQRLDGYTERDDAPHVPVQPLHVARAGTTDVFPLVKRRVNHRVCLWKVRDERRCSG